MKKVQDKTEHETTKHDKTEYEKHNKTKTIKLLYKTKTKIKYKYVNCILLCKVWLFFLTLLFCFMIALFSRGTILFILV